MKIVTWNVNSLAVRLPRLVEFLELHEPDIVCLQETKSEASRVPDRGARGRGRLPSGPPQRGALGRRGDPCPRRPVR